MGELIEKIVIKVLPDLEVTIKGTHSDMVYLGAKVMKALRARGLHPDLEMIPTEAVINALKEIH